MRVVLPLGTMNTCKYGEVLFWKAEFGLGQIRDLRTGEKVLFSLSGHRDAEQTNGPRLLWSGEYIGPKWLEPEQKAYFKLPIEGDRVVYDNQFFGRVDDPVWDYMICMESRALLDRPGAIPHV